MSSSVSSPPLSGEPVVEVARIDLAGSECDVFRAERFTRRFPPHFHDTFAIGVMCEGASQLRTHRGEWISGPGSIIALSPREVHSATALTSEGYSYRTVYPSVTQMSAIGAMPAVLSDRRSSFRSPVIHDPPLADQLESAHVALMRGDAGERADVALIEALRSLVRNHGARADQTNPARVHDVEVVETACRYLHRHVADSVTLSALAAECGVSLFHLIRVFRRVMGVAPYAYLVQLRVNRAQAMLCNGTGVSEVAYSCGFSDQSHLTRVFRKVVGIPPGQYVRRLRPTAVA